jgi:hypothetical protein
MILPIATVNPVNAGWHLCKRAGGTFRTHHRQAALRAHIEHARILEMFFLFRHVRHPLAVSQTSTPSTLFFACAARTDTIERVEQDNVF